MNIHFIDELFCDSLAKECCAGRRCYVKLLKRVGGDAELFKALKRFSKLATYSGNIQNTVEYEHRLKCEEQEMMKKKNAEKERRKSCFKVLSVSVKSQMRRALKLYTEFLNSK